MILFSNFRKIKEKNIVKVVCNTDIVGGGGMLPASELWISTSIENESFLNEKICDGYLIAGMVFGMYYGQNVKISGKVSKKLFRNMMNYGQQILINHDPGLQKIDIEVDGFTTESDYNNSREIVGAPCSFGVDSLSTLYDRWFNEEDIKEKITTIFDFNCGINGSFEDQNTKKLHSDREKWWKKGFGELGLPIVNIDTNIHQYLHNKMYVYAAACYFSRYFCILNMDGIKKYYLPSGFSYKDVLKYGYIPFQPIIRGSKDISICYEEPMFFSLLSTEYRELVLDGAQYQRTTKIERITNWDFSYKYLNVCQPGRQTDEKDLSSNCSVCPKCSYTLFCLDVMGKLDLYRDVFNIKKYYANRYVNICNMVMNRKDDCLIHDVLDYAESKGVIIPNEQDVRKYLFYQWKYYDFDKYIAIIDEIYNTYLDKKMILWGAGFIGSIVSAALDCLNIQDYEVVDINSNKINSSFFGHLVKDWAEMDFRNSIVIVCGKGIFNEINEKIKTNAKCIDVLKEREDREVV